jgi:hypothetical protein
MLMSTVINAFLLLSPVLFVMAMALQFDKEYVYVD